MQKATIMWYQRILFLWHTD